MAFPLIALPLISVVVPTVDGREDHLDRCIAAYRACAVGSYQLDLIIIRNEPSCGAGWQAGADYAVGEYLHFTDDDIEPKPGWAEPAIEAVQGGYLPAPQVYNTNGAPQSHPAPGFVAPDWTPVHMTALPFVSRAQYEKIQPLFTAHYFTDDWFSFRGEQFGWETRLRTDYSFVHWWAQVKRGAGLPSESHRMQHDQGLYLMAQKMARAGQWTEPWPPNGGLP